jgi:hypothetical protein
MRSAAGAVVRVLLAVGALSATAAVPAAAQSCFRGGPEPRCASFWIAEAGLSFGPRRQIVSPRGPSTGHLLTWEIGWMRNAGANLALGGSTFLEGDGIRMAGWRAGVKARYRRWLGPDRSLDIEPGVVVAGEENFSRQVPGALIVVGYNLGDVTSITLQVEALQYENQSIQTAGYVGVRLGSFAGLAAAALALLAGALNIPPIGTAF